jgi:hypothetical protein
MTWQTPLYVLRVANALAVSEISQSFNTSNCFSKTSILKLIFIDPIAFGVLDSSTEFARFNRSLGI